MRRNSSALHAHSDGTFEVIEHPAHVRLQSASQ
jgi:hypothetical protein